MARSWQRYDGPLPTLSSTIRAHCWLTVWCKADTCRLRMIHIDPDSLADDAERLSTLSTNITLLDFQKLLRCSVCGGKDIDMIVSGTGPQTVSSAYPPPLSTPAAHSQENNNPASRQRRRRSRHRAPRIG